MRRCPSDLFDTIESPLVHCPGSLILGADSAAGLLVFDMTSFDADTAAARSYLGLSGTTGESTRSQVNENMKGRDVLDVQRFPTASFEIASAMASGESNSRISMADIPERK